MDLVAEDGGRPGQLVAYWHDEAGRTVEYASIDQWLEALVRSMENETLELS